MLKICITNLREYTVGRLTSEWVDLPAEKEALQEITNRLSNNGQDELFISDYETDIGIILLTYDSIESLNNLVSEFVQLDAYETEIVMTLLSDGHPLDDALEKKDRACIFYKCNDMTDVAYDYLTETGMIPQNLEDYFNYEAYGRDMQMKGEFIFNKNGNCVQVW